MVLGAAACCTGIVAVVVSQCVFPVYWPAMIKMWHATTTFERSKVLPASTPPDVRDPEPGAALRVRVELRRLRIGYGTPWCSRVEELIEAESIDGVEYTQRPATRGPVRSAIAESLTTPEMASALEYTVTADDAQQFLDGGRIYEVTVLPMRYAANVLYARWWLGAVVAALVFVGGRVLIWWRMRGRAVDPCEQCGYELSGISGRRCPECGGARDARR